MIEDFGALVSFHYSRKFNTLACSSRNGAILKLWTINDYFVKIGHLKVLETVDTNGFSPMIELSSKGLLFQGGIDSVVVIDLKEKDVVARFYI